MSRELTAGLRPGERLTVSSLIGRSVRGPDGEPAGRIADLITERGPDGRERVVAAMVTHGRWGRLLGYERDEATGPWLLEHLARRLMRQHCSRISWTDVRH